MKKRLFLFLFLVATFCAQAQDKLITRHGDTLDVNIPGDPWRELKIHYSNLGQSLDYGFQRIAVLYGPDSIRIHPPFQIRAFYKRESGKHLAAGYYESAVIYENQLLLNVRQRETLKGEPRPVFRQRLFLSDKIGIWYYREHATYNRPNSYFFVEMPGGEKPAVFITYHEWMDWAKEHPPFDAISKEITAPPKKNRGNLYGYFAEIGKKYTEQTQ